MEIRRVNKQYKTLHQLEDYQTLIRNDSNNPWTGETSNSALDFGKNGDNTGSKLQEFPT